MCRVLCGVINLICEYLIVTGTGLPRAEGIPGANDCIHAVRE